MTEHALDRQMGLAGVGGSKHRGDAGAGSPFVVERCRRREGHFFRMFLLGAGFSQRSYTSVLAKVSHIATYMGLRFKLRNDSRTKGARITDSTPCPASFTATSSASAAVPH